jgi:hypothetical protein
MDYILNCNHYTPAEIRKLNYCRLHLEVVTVSDLTLPCGTMMDVDKARCTPAGNSSRNSCLSVHQEKPSPAEWRLWRRACLLWSDINGKLRTPLGRWLVPPAHQRQRPFAYIHLDHLWIRQEDVDEYRVYRRYEIDEGFHALQRAVNITEIPNHAVPAAVTRISAADVWTVSEPPHREHAVAASPRSPPTLTFADYVNTLSPWEKTLLQYSEFVSTPFEFCVDLQHSLRAVSDGSVRHETQGAFGWSMRNERGETVATGMGPAHGGGKVTSYRAEAYGMLSILRFLIRMAEFAEMQLPWTGVIATDSQSVLDTLFGHDEARLDRDRDEPINLNGSKVVLNCAAPDWDVLIEIQDSLEKLPNISLSYVKGHQDRTRSYQELDVMGQLNVDADRKASEFQDAHGATRPIVLLMPRTKVHLVGPQGTITSHYGDYLRHAATATPLQEYIRTKYSWDDSVMTSINWEAHRMALKKLYKRRTHLTKMVFEILPTMAQMNKFDNGRRTCPSCTCPHEDRDHILRCLATRRVEWRIEFMASFAEFCRKTQTDTEIQMLLRIGWEQWFSSPDGAVTIQPELFSPRLSAIIQQQNLIGWRQLFNGRFSGEWSRVQHAAYAGRARDQDNPVKRTGEKWQVQLIIHIWTQWERAWTDRNQAVHGNTATTRNEAIRREVGRQLEVIYQNRHLMEPSVQEILYDQPEDHARQPITTTRNWLAQYAPVFKESIRRAKSRALRNVRSIRSYFPSASGG